MPRAVPALAFASLGWVIGCAGGPESTVTSSRSTGANPATSGSSAGTTAGSQASSSLGSAGASAGSTSAAARSSGNSSASVSAGTSASSAGTAAATSSSAASARSTSNGVASGSAAASSSTGSTGVAASASGTGTSGSSGRTLQVPASSGSLAEDFDIAIHGTGPDGLAFDLAQGVGTVSHGDGGAWPAFIYERQPWPQYGYTLYQTLAVGPSAWELGWFYCSGTTLTDLDDESTDAPTLQSLAITGTCEEAASPVSETPNTPADTLDLGSVVQGFTVSGATLELSGAGEGSMQLNGVTYTVHPFAVVDCSTGCGTPGWYELHSVYWDPSQAGACFGIFYLQIGQSSTVALDYSICLPGLNDPTGGGASFQAAWSKG